MKYHGIVISMRKNKVIVSTNDFQCFYIKRSPTACIGEQIEFTEKEIIKKRPALTKLVLAAACIAILFTICSFLNFLSIFNIKDILFEQKVFAYVDVDINPSLEMEIDDMGNVLKLIPLNEDAKVLIKKIKLDKINASKAIDTIIDEVKKNKAANETEKDYILVSSTLNSKENDKKYQVEAAKLDTMMNSLKKDVQESEKVNVYLLETNMDERKDAQNEGISTGRYLLYNKYRNLKSNFSIEEAKKANVNELVKGLLNNKAENGSPDMPGSTIPPLKDENTKLNVSSTPSIKHGGPEQADGKGIDPDIANKVTAKNDLTKSNFTNNSTKNLNAPFMKFESYNYPGKFIRHQSFRGHISDNVTPADDSVFKMVPGLADPDCISFESKNFPGYYLMHKNFKIVLEKCDDSDNFKGCATFRKVSGLADKNLVSFQSFNYPKRYIRHMMFYLQIDEINSDLDRKDATFTEIKVK